MYKNRVEILMVLTVILLIIGFSSCDSSNSKYLLGDKVIKKGEIIDFELSKELSTKFIQFQYYDSKIFCLNKMNDTSIYIFNLKGKQIGTLRYKRKGPNGVGDISGFYVHNYDSIFVLNSYAYKLFLINNEGRVHNVYSLFKTGVNKNFINTTLPYVNSAASMSIRNEFIYVPAIPDQSPFINNYEDNNLLIKLNLKTSLVEYMLGFPEEYKGFYIYGTYTFVSTCQTANDSCIAVSYILDKNLYTYNYISDELDKINNSKCNFLDDVELPKKLPPPPNEEKERVLEALQTDKYGGIYYDKWHNIFYRFAIKGLSHKDAKKYCENGRGLKLKYFLMVYDEDLVLIAERRIEDMSSGLELFVTEKGLYIKGDYENEEDKVFFQQYIVSDK